MKNIITSLMLVMAMVVGSVAVAAEPAPTEVVVPELTTQAVFLTKEAISKDEQQKIINALAELEKRTKVAMTVLVVDSVAPFAIEEYSIKVAEKWKIGKAKEDNGLIFVIATQDRKARLEVGYGMEGKITDAMSSRILKDYVNPEFKNKNWYDGIIQAIGRVENIVTDKPLDAPLNPELQNISSTSKTNKQELSGEAAAIAAIFSFFGTNIGKAILIGLVIGGIASFFRGLIGLKAASGIGAVGSGIVSFLLVDGYFYVAVISGGIFGLIGIAWLLDVLQALASSSGRGGSSGSSSNRYSGGGGKFGGGGSSSSW